MLNLTLRQLQVFESTARHLSLSRAAEELHLSQPGVSMQIKKLSEAVGQPLLVLNGKRVQLTDQGQELVGAARDILGALKRFELSLVARTGLAKGNLRLVAISTATYFVPRLLGEFAQLHPGVKASLRVANREQLLESLSAGLEDLYILGQPPEGLAVTAFPFMDNPLVVLAAPDHPLAHKKHISLARLAEEPWLMREPGSGTRKAVERLFADHGLSLTPHERKVNFRNVRKQRAALGFIQLPPELEEVPLPEFGRAIVRFFIRQHPAHSLIRALPNLFISAR